MQSITNDVKLLSQIPVSRLPQHVQNLRNTLLLRAGLSLEDSTLKAIKDDIRQRLPGIFEPDIERDAVTLDDVCGYSNLTWAIKSEVGQWIRCGVASHYKETSRYVCHNYHCRSLLDGSLDQSLPKSLPLERKKFLLSRQKNSLSFVGF